MSGIGVDMTGLAVAVPSRDRLGEAVGQGGLSGSGRQRSSGSSAVLGATPMPAARYAGRRAGAARSPGRLAMVVLVAVLAVGVGGCTSPGSEPAGSLATVSGSATTTTGTSTGTSTGVAPSSGRTGAEVDAVLAAYRGMWEAMASAGRTSDWRSPELARYARDAALQKITQSLYGDSQNGLVTQGEPRLSPQVTDLVPDGAPTEARVLDCGDDSGWVKYRADGARADDVTGGRRRITAIVGLGADGWKVADFAIQAVGTC